ILSLTHRLGWSLIGIALLLAFPTACRADELPSSSAVSITQDSATVDAADLEPLLTDVVYLGERHDSARDHGAQLDIIEALYTEDPDMAIAMEMFQRPFQPVIDRYLAGEISEDELVAGTEYEQRWGFPWEFYAPIVRFAKEKDIPLLALNAPAEVTRQVAREGLESLEEPDFRYIPPLEDIDVTNESYQAFVMAAFGAHGSHGNFNFDNFFAAQVIWDETMAATVAEFKQASPQTRVVVLAGSGHVMYGYGIPSRVARRLEDIDQTLVLLNPVDEVAGEAEVADVLWFSPAETSSP
ncbi:MAG: ChaN family lipoprotein, partial [Cyanobacteria bacterium P01_A01_bin.135]